jgi:hypothetical protein
VIHLEGGHFQAGSREHDSLLDVLGGKHRSFRRRSVVVESDPNVVLERLLEVRHHLPGTPRPPHVEGHGPPGPNEPSGEPEVRKADDVIRMQVRQEHALHVLPANARLLQTLQRSASGVEEQLLISGFDQDARPEAVHRRLGATGTQQRHLEREILAGRRQRAAEQCSRDSEDGARSHREPPAAYPAPLISRRLAAAPASA